MVGNGVDVGTFACTATPEVNCTPAAATSSGVRTHARLTLSANSTRFNDCYFPPTNAKTLTTIIYFAIVLREKLCEECLGDAVSVFPQENAQEMVNKRNDKLTRACLEF